MGCCTAAPSEPSYHVTYNELNKCDEIDFFNTLQIQHSLCIDAQNASNYERSHIKYSLNIPFDNDQLTDTDIAIPIIDAKKGLSFCKHICFYVNNINNIDEKDNILRIINLLLKHKIVTDTKQFYILSVEFDVFRNKFCFYCSSNRDDTDKDKINEEYPNIIIENRLYLGDAPQSQNEKVMNDLNIKYILNCTKDWSNRFEHNANIKYLRIPIEDNDGDNIFDHFENAISFINKGDIVLVHCQAGISRSASIIIAYIMKTKNMNYQEAYQWVKDKRQWISPNDGFVKQLKQYHQLIVQNQSDI